MNSYQMLVNILDEKLGVVFLDDKQDDFIISDYVVDSIAFIQFIIVIIKTQDPERLWMLSKLILPA